MSRRLALITVIFCFIFSFLFFVPRVLTIYAADDTTIKELDQLAGDEEGLSKALKDFCAKRQGNQMNLETWYSGKCTDDTFSGEGVGFSDIVILDLAEKIAGKNDPDQSFSKTLRDLFGEFTKIESLNTEQENKQFFADARQKIFSTNQGGLITGTEKLVASLYKYQPATTQSYIAYVSSNLQKHKVIPTALAANTNGSGFEAFAPFLTIWTVFRNLAYLIMVIFFIIYGFMMMFRINLGQKTAITIQLAIPKLVVTLLIITFSYAIVGLLYDFMWVIFFFIFQYLTSQGLIVNGPVWHPAVTASGMGTLGLMGSFAINFLASIPASLLGINNLIFGGGASGGISAAASIVLTLYFGKTLLIIISIFLLIFVLVSYGKLFIKLITAFITIVISLVTGPLILLGNAFPGSKVIGTWFRGIFANLMVFPVTALLLLFSYLLMVQPLIGACQTTGDAWTTFWQKPKTSTFCTELFGVTSLVPGISSNVSTGAIPLITPALAGGFDGRNLLALVGLGLLLMSSKYVDYVKEALKAPSFKYGSDIAEALKVSQSIYSSGKKGVQDLSTRRGSGTSNPSASTSPTDNSAATQTTNTRPQTTSSTKIPAMKSNDSGYGE